MVKFHEKCYNNTIRFLVERKGDYMSNKLEELLNTVKINELLHKKEMEDEKKNTIFWLLAIIGAIAAVAAISYAVFKYFSPDYLEDFEDDFDDDFDDDFYDDDEVVEVNAKDTTN